MSEKCPVRNNLAPNLNAEDGNLNLDAGIFFIPTAIAQAVYGRYGNARALTDQLLFETTLPQFLGYKRLRHPPCEREFDWVDDGCSKSPDHPFGFNLHQSCLRHDFGYRNYKKQGRFRLTDLHHHENRKRIDHQFRHDLRNECARQGDHNRDICKGLAETYFTFVRLLGGTSAHSLDSAEHVPKIPGLPKESSSPCDCWIQRR